MPPSGICAIVPSGGDERDVAHPARQPVDPPRGEPGDQRQDDADERHQAVAELDRSRGRPSRERLVAAARPVVAAEARGGQADDGPARDDDPEREDGRGRELDEPAGRDAGAGARAFVGHAVDAVAADLHAGLP